MKKTQATGKVVREIMVAARMGRPGPGTQCAAGRRGREGAQGKRLARCDRAGHKERSGSGEDKIAIAPILLGYAPHKVPVIVEVYTNNVNHGPGNPDALPQGATRHHGSNKFLHHTGIVEADDPDPKSDLEAAGIEAGANDVQAMGTTRTTTSQRNGCARFLTGIAPRCHAVSMWLSQARMETSLPANWVTIPRTTRN